MAKTDKNPNMNTSKRLPIVFCLDVSKSMGKKNTDGIATIDILNHAVSECIESIKQSHLGKHGAEISFITYGTSTQFNTDFEFIDSLNVPVFTVAEDEGTQMSASVIYAIEKINLRCKTLIDVGIPYYSPLLIILTDGDPSQTDKVMQYNQAISLILEHSNINTNCNKLIIPLAVGVGNLIEKNTLNQFFGGTMKSCICMNDIADVAKPWLDEILACLWEAGKFSTEQPVNVEAILNLLAELSDFPTARKSGEDIHLRRDTSCAPAPDIPHKQVPGSNLKRIREEKKVHISQVTMEILQNDMRALIAVLTGENNP